MPNRMNGENQSTFTNISIFHISTTSHIACQFNNCLLFSVVYSLCHSFFLYHLVRHLHQQITLPPRVMIGTYLFLSGCAQETVISTFSFSTQHKTQGQPLRSFFSQTGERVFCAYLQFNKGTDKDHTLHTKHELSTRVFQTTCRFS